MVHFDKSERGLEIQRLSDEIAVHAARCAAATHALLTSIRRFDEIEGWGSQGALSCAHWLSWRIGVLLGTAREYVRVAKALGGLPLMDAALRRGAVSYCMVRAMTRVATPANEATLLEMARCSTGAQLEEVCRKFKSVTDTMKPVDPDADDARRWIKSSGRSDDGYDRLVCQMRPQERAIVLKALQAAQVAATRKERGKDVSSETYVAFPEDQTGGTSARLGRVDALVAICEAFLAQADDPSRVPGRYEVVVHVDEPALRGEPERSRCCELEDHTPISPHVARQIGCDAAVTEARPGPPTREGGAELVFSERKRTIPAALRRALYTRDRQCRFPGCTNRIFVDAHHVVHWADGGPTELSNLVLMCRRHHTLVHPGGFSCERGAGGTFTFRDPEGRVVPPTGLEPPKRDEDLYVTLVSELDEAGIDIRPEVHGLWDGGRPDYGHAV